MVQTELAAAEHPWSAWISIDGAPVPLYSIESKPELKKVVAYIEAKDGQNFKVHLRGDTQGAPPTDYSLSVWLDGQWMNGWRHRKTSSRWLGPAGDARRVSSFEGCAVNESALRPFVFGKPALTEDGGCVDEHIIKNLGTVQLRVCRIHIQNHLPRTVRTYHQVPDLLLNEKSKTAMVSHTAQLGNVTVKSTGHKTTSPRLSIDLPDDPMLTLEFRYLSRDLLELQGHVEPLPKSVSPPPTGDRKGKKRAVETITIDSDDSDDDEAEARKLRERLAELERKQAKKVKPENGAEVKKEKGVKEEKGAKLEKGVVLEID